MSLPRTGWSVSWVSLTGTDAREQMEDCDSHLYTPGASAATLSPCLLASPLRLWRLALLPVLVQLSLTLLTPLFYLMRLQTSLSPIFPVFFIPCLGLLLAPSVWKPHRPFSEAPSLEGDYYFLKMCHYLDRFSVTSNSERA